MSEENFQYITEPLKSLILTPSANSGLKFFSSLYPRETFSMSVRDKITIGNLEI
jgi:hypothetical protein